MGRLGAGVISYFTLLKLIFFLFGLAVLVNIPTLISYRNREHLSLFPKYESFAFRNSIGHLGVKQQECTRVKLPAKFFKLRCNFGQISEIIDWGVNHLGSEQDDDNLCSSSSEPCGTIGTENHPMSKMINACKGKVECLI